MALEEVVELDVGFAIVIGFFGGDMMTVVLFITALTLDDTETSISSTVAFSEEGPGIKNLFIIIESLNFVFYPPSTLFWVFAGASLVTGTQSEFKG